MAKQAVGPVIRYLDKAVLAVCGIVFLYFVAMYGVMSPNKAGEPGAEQYGPGEIDLIIKDDAERLRDRLLNAEAPPTPTPSPMPDLQVMDNVLALANITPTIPSPVTPGLPLPATDQNRETEQKPVDLVGVLALGKPDVVMGRSGVYLTPPEEFKPGEATPRNDATYLQDTNWVTVYAPFDRARQEEMFRQANHGRYAVAVALGMDVERRMQTPGGGWSEWTAITPTRQMAEPSLAPPLVERTPKGIYEVPEADRKLVDEFFQKITDGQNNEAQCALLRPLFPLIAYGKNWTYPRPEGLDVLLMDSDYQKEPRCRYPECEASVEQIDTTAKFSDLMKSAEAALKEARFSVARKYAEAAQAAATRDTSKTDEKKAADLIAKIDIEDAKSRQEMLSQRQIQPIQLAWSHDAGAALLSGRTYQYRARIRLYNMFCGRPTLLNQPTDASIVELVGEWSEPSKPIYIEPDTQFFVRSDKASAQEVKVEVFKWYAGEWLMRPFNVTIGNLIGEPKTMNTPAGEKRTVDFGTGAMVIDLDFRHRAMIPDRRSHRLASVDTVAMVYVDASGNLHQQLLELDKNSNTYDELRRQLWKE